MSPTELWLPVGAAAFYLYDSALLLWQNELVYTRSGSAWLIDGGSEFRVGARRLFVPQPLLPHRPHFLVRWSAASPDGDLADGVVPTELLGTLRPIGIINLLQVGLLCTLPILLWTIGAGFAVLLLFALYYSLTLVALAHAFRRRRVLHLSTRGAWLQALDVLACAPFAANLTRRLAMQHGLPGDPLLFGQRQFAPQARQKMQEIVTMRVREEIGSPGIPAAREQQLRAVLERLGG